jgi:hypothetical protein
MDPINESSEELLDEEYAFLPTIPIPDLKCSYFLGQPEGKESKLMLKLEEGRLKNIIVSLKDFKIIEETSNLTFDYQIEYNPYKKEPPKKALELFIKKCVQKIINDTLKSIATEKRKYNEARKSDSKESDKE